MLTRLRRWARSVKRDVVALYLASRDPRVPWYPALAIFVAGCALSPIDLIPDFIPLLGYLDDVLIVPLGILLVVRHVPADTMAGPGRRRCRLLSVRLTEGRPPSLSLSGLHL